MNSLVDLKQLLADPWWRLTSGALYKIMVKDGDDDEGLVMPFIPNEHQLELFQTFHNRNIILKARQLGFTTAIAIYFLDCALFRKDVRAGMIAQTDDIAKSLFRDKVKFAYDNLPQALRDAMPLERDSASELLFSHNNSSIRVSTSMRSGTLQYLHVSEFGKICAKFPERAEEVVKGSIPAVAPSGIIFIESTAEGQEGHFYRMSEQARKNKESSKQLTAKDYKFHFFPWWGAKEYRIATDDVVITDKDHKYFDAIEQSEQCTIDPEQRAWYVATRDTDFSGDEQSMWQEYPSTPQEAFQQSNEGCYYTDQMARLRKEKRICDVPYQEGVVVNTFWDIGNSDGTAIWLHQRVGMQDRFIRFIEGWGESYSYYVKMLQDLGYVWGKHFLPHDADHKRQGMTQNLSPRQMLEELGLRNIEIVRRCDELQHGIQQTRTAMMGDIWIDQTHCKEGIVHLDRYKKRWNEKTERWSDEPLKDKHTEGADSFRQFAQSLNNIGARPVPPPPKMPTRTHHWNRR